MNTTKAVYRIPKLRRKHTIRKIVLVFFILFIFSPLSAGELYHCIDRNGNSIITDCPQDGMKNCALGDSWKDPSPEELAKKKKYIDKQNAIEEYNKKITEENKEKFKKEYLEQQRKTEEGNEKFRKYRDCQNQCSASSASCDSDCRHSSFRSCYKSCSESYDRCISNNRCKEYLK